MPQNRQVKAKRKANQTSFKKGQVANPGGRPHDGVSFASVLRDFLAMDGQQIAAVCKAYASEFKKLPEGVNMRQLIALKWIMAIMNDPTPGLLQQLVDRVDGPVPTKIEGTENPIRVLMDK